MVFHYNFDEGDIDYEVDGEDLSQNLYDLLRDEFDKETLVDIIMENIDVDYFKDDLKELYEPNAYDKLLDEEDNGVDQKDFV